MAEQDKLNVLIVGAGLFGCCTAIELAKAGFKIDIIDSDNDIMNQASRVNHNRIHLGYHYLRSVETAEQSIEGLLSFMFNYGHAIENQFDNYYAIAKDNSKTTSEEFLNFCSRTGIGYDYEFPDEKLLDRTMLSDCFKVPEPVFDYMLLKKMVGENVVKSKVNLLLKTKLEALKKDGTQYTATYNGSDKKYDVVINASYAGFNNVNSMLNIPLKKLLYEKVVIPEFKYDSAAFGLTVMDGPFCSVMPKGKQQNEFLLYHVKYSIIENQLTEILPDFKLETKDSFKSIYENSQLFMPFLKTVCPNGFREITRVVHKNDDDARLTELYTYDGFANYFSILSGKITTCVQVALEIKHILQGRNLVKRVKI
jgi:hypothetical protein